MNTALILRPKDAPQIHILEVDGPRRKYCQRGEGFYRLLTDNHPDCDELELRVSDGRRGIFRDWDEPYWQIIQNHDGSIEVHASRPTKQEGARGDLHGRWGSVIYLGRRPSRQCLRYALSVARILNRCIPTIGFTINPGVLMHFHSIVSDIPVRTNTPTLCPILKAS